jgi:hypothetical protein
VLREVFGYNQLSSFVRQLYKHGFKKVKNVQALRFQHQHYSRGVAEAELVRVPGLVSPHEPCEEGPDALDRTPICERLRSKHLGKPQPTAQLVPRVIDWVDTFYWFQSWSKHPYNHLSVELCFCSNERLRIHNPPE